MTRTFFGLSVGKSFVSLSKLFALAFLLFSGAEVYAQVCGQDSGVTYEKYEKPADDTASSAADFLKEKIALRQEISSAFKQMEWLGIHSRSVDDGQREKDAEDAYKNRLAKYKKNYQIDYDKDEIKPEETRVADKRHENEAQINGTIIDELPVNGRKFKDFVIVRGEKIKPSETAAILHDAFHSADQLSSRISLTDAATRKLGADKNSGNKQRAKFLEIKREYDEAITGLAQKATGYSFSPDGTVLTVHFAGHGVNLSKDYFSERFVLEFNKRKNLVSDADYQAKKVEIDDRYAQKYALAAASLSPNDLARLIVEIAAKVSEVRDKVSALEKIEPVLARWSSFLASALAFPLLGYLIIRRKERRETAKEQREEQEFAWRQKEFEWRQTEEERKKREFEMMELEKRRREKENILLDLKIEEQRNKLARQSKSAAKNKNRRNNNSDRGN